MSIFNWPYTNFHELNLDWVLRTMKTAVEAVEHMADSLESYAQRLQQAENDIDALEGSRVSYAAEQQLSSTQKQQARTNIDAAPAIGVVYYNQEMALDNTYKATARDNIGAAAASAIPDVSDVVRTSAQTFTTEQQAQARSNIGAGSENDINALESSRVSYAAEQQLTTTQKQRARTNIDAAPAIGVVYYNQDMALDSTYKATARNNIGAAAAADIPGASDVVRTSAQTLTTEQQAQARTNIAAAAASAIPDVSDVVRTTVQMFTDSQKMRARSNINAAEEPIVVDYTQDTGAITIEAIQNDHIYEIGNGATSVTITSIYPAAKSYMIVLTTGSTAPTVTGLSGVKGLENWAPDANTIYEISVYDNRAVVGSWEVTT